MCQESEDLIVDYKILLLKKFERTEHLEFIVANNLSGNKKMKDLLVLIDNKVKLIILNYFK